MKELPPALDAKEQISALIATLHATGKSLEELTIGEVDTVADHEGQTFVLRHAQEHLRNVETAKQAAILNALPAYIALVDTQGVILSVNDAWRRYSNRNVIHAPGLVVGLNYLETCDGSRGDDSVDAHRIAEGIRRVLGGGIDSFAIEYRCSSLTEECWLMLTATPLPGYPPIGAAVMHVDVTERNRTMLELRESERRFSDMLANVELISLMLDKDARIIFCNDYLLRLTDRQREEVIGKDWFELFIPSENTDVRRVFNALLANLSSAAHNENEILTRAGTRRMIRWSNTVLHDGAGEVIGTTSIGEDITDRKSAEEVLIKRAGELERFHRLSVGREMQMIELKKEVNALTAQAGREPPYKVSSSA